MAREEQFKEFYVGYRAQNGPHLSRFVRKRIRHLFFYATVIGLLILLCSKGSGDGRFEFGTQRDFEGLLSLDPVPTLLVERPGQVDTSSKVSGFSSYLLVNPQKFGAFKGDRALHGKRVKLKGSLIYRDQQTAIEIDEASVEVLSQESLPPSESLGLHTFQGEIVDSKCYLGVMRPGNLKTHRACAIQCIRGGVPPVLIVRDSLDHAVYLFLVGEEGEAVNDKVLGMVAEGIEVTGEVERQGTRLILKADPADYIRL